MPYYDHDKDYPFAAFITNIGKYNEGELVGEWVKIPTIAEELQEVFKRIGIVQKDDSGNPYEEWFITDYDDLGAITLRNWKSLGFPPTCRTTSTMKPMAGMWRSMTAYEPKQEVAAGIGVLPGVGTAGGSITISAKNVLMAASRVSGRVWSLVRITIPNYLKSVKIRVEKPQNNSMYPYFQREPL